MNFSTGDAAYDGPQPGKALEVRMKIRVETARLNQLPGEKL
jgi:hypothetical protein